MKKIFTLAFGLGLTFAANAQVQRMVLSEEFTNASCGPCASQNPAYNALMDANTTKVVTLKYQTVWPGVDPMNAQNQSDVATRVTYYGVNGVPTAPLDGDTALAQVDGYYFGAPHNITQTAIDSRYAMPSHWSMGLTHHLSADLDSIYITLTVTPDATNPAITGLKLHIALIEKEINFIAPPGTNGETDFFNVMRKMYPSAAGQNLNAANASGVFTYTVAQALPAYLYDLNQVGVVAFIQDNASWDVKQAAMSQPVALAIDGALTAVTAVTGDFFCGTSFVPTVTLKNSGATTLTSATISYMLDGGAAQTFNYTGSLVTGATAVVTLPSLTLTGGGHTFTAMVTMVNGAADINTGNNSQSKLFTNYAGGASAAGYSNLFATSPLTTGTYSVINADAAATWTYSTATATTGGGSMRMNFYQSAAGKVDQLILPPFSTTGSTAVKFAFKHAASQYTNATTPLTNDKIELMYSRDCGTTWTAMWSKTGADLATNGAPSGTAAFVPSASQWVLNEVQLPSLALNQPSLLIKFEATSDFGNMAYIDEINISSNVGIQDITNGNSLNVYPNPFSESTTLKLALAKSENVTISIVNSFGALVKTENKGKMQAGESLINIDGANLAAGIYLMNVTVGNKTYSQKVNVVK